MAKKQLVFLDENGLREAMSEQTLILCKTESIRVGMFPEILARISRLYFKFAALKMIQFTPSAVSDFYGPVIEMWEPPDKMEKIFMKMTESPSIAAVVEGPNAVLAMRKLAGGTPAFSSDDSGKIEIMGYDAQFKPILAGPGTIRGDYSASDIEIPDTNLIPVPNFMHASATKAEFDREVSILKKHDLLTGRDFFTYERPEWSVLFGGRLPTQ